MEPKKPEAFVFDSNAYRKLVNSIPQTSVRSTIAGIVARQAYLHYVSYANIFVTAELLTHLSDPTDPSFDVCRKAVIAVWSHCMNSNGTSLMFMPDPEMQFAKDFYGVEDPCHRQLYENIGQICRYIYDNDADDDLGSIRSELTKIKQVVDKTEDQFINDVFSCVVRSINPIATNWQIFESDNAEKRRLLNYLDSSDSSIVLAAAQVERFRSVAKVEDVPDGILEKAQLIAARFPTALMLYKEILRRIVKTGCDLTKKSRANWIWDMQIGFLVGGDIRGKVLALVTDDRDILRSAVASGTRKSVLKLSEFHKLLNTSTP